MSVAGVIALAVADVWGRSTLVLDWVNELRDEVIRLRGEITDDEIARVRASTEFAAGEALPDPIRARLIERPAHTFTCQCCGVTATFDTLADALEASWDVPPAFQVTICPGCSSAMFVLGQQADCPHHRRTGGQPGTRGQPR